MPNVNVSKDALLKVKTALNNFNIDISGLSERIEQQFTDISKSVDFEMQRIAQQIEDTKAKINQLTIKIKQLEETINQMESEIKTFERKIEKSQNSLPFLQDEADKLKEQIANLEQRLNRTEDTEARARLQEEINQLRKALSNLEREIRHLQDEISRMKQLISQLHQKINDARYEKSMTEDELRATERLLDRLVNKQERMKTTSLKIKDNMEDMLSASKAFETRALSETEQSTGSIEKCITAIDEYLT